MRNFELTFNWILAERCQQEIKDGIQQTRSKVMCQDTLGLRFSDYTTLQDIESTVMMLFMQQFPKRTIRIIHDSFEKLKGTVVIEVENPDDSKPSSEGADEIQAVEVLGQEKTFMDPPADKATVLTVVEKIQPLKEVKNDENN